MKPIYVFGHKKPDTDSVTGAITVSYLKNQLGLNTEPRVLGELNRETEFVLNYFNIEKPDYLNDVKLQIKDLHYQKDYYLYKDDSIYFGYQYMVKNLMSTLPVINEKHQFQGLVSMKDITKNLVEDNLHLDTSYQNILNTINGHEVLKFDDNIIGDLLVCSYKSTTIIDSIPITRDTIVIVGNRHSIIEYAVENKARALIITGGHEVKPEHIEIARKNHVNIIQSPLHTLSVARKITLSNPICSLILKGNVISFHENDYVSDFRDIANKTKYRNYPVLNQNDECLGIIRLSDVSEQEKKQVILVDHNEAPQSVEGLDEAEISEIIDHHRLGLLGTAAPINFRNMPVGCTNTIVYQLYKENQVEIPKEIAGLMMSAILSDTMILTSPTTTEMDKKVVSELSKITKLDPQKFGMEMFKAGTSLEGKSLEDILFSDFKNFTIENQKIGIGQVFTMDIDEIKKKQDAFIELINNVAEQQDSTVVALFITDVIHNGSYLLYNDHAKEILSKAFQITDMEQGYYLDGCVSRKKQVVPNITSVLQQ